jgi:hypothetical protein
MYADIEAILKDINTVKGAKTTLTQQHYPVAIGNIIKSRIPNHELNSKYVKYSGEDCMQHFVEYLEQICAKISADAEEFLTRVKAQRTASENFIFNKAKKCYMCNTTFIFKDDEKSCKNFDHDHLTGKYKGAACNTCNRKMVQARTSIAVYFHNYRGYDNHHIVHACASKKTGY